MTVGAEQQVRKQEFRFRLSLLSIVKGADRFLRSRSVIERILEICTFADGVFLNGVRRVFILNQIPVKFDCRKWFSSCLLYTSPSPRDLSTSRMPSSA